MEKRAKINKKDLKKVYQKLKEEGHTLRSINSFIDSDFRNYLYKDHSIDIETFEKLQTLYGSEIPHEERKFVNGKENIEEFKELKENKNVAELVGIILGDGRLQKEPQSYLCITLHEDEKELIARTKELCRINIDKKPKEYELKDSRAVQLKLHSVELIDKLTDLGLIPGNKVENQVTVPRWIKSSKSFQKRCLRGLVDTDGSIYTQSIDDRTIIRFKNKSKPLLTDFKEMCRNLNIKPSNGGGEYSVQVAAQKEVSDFIDKIEPIKAQNIT